MKNIPALMGLEAYFPELDVSQSEFTNSGYVSAYLSIFDHWLTEDEADKCAVLTYKGAEAAGFLQEYLAGEEKFLNFYMDLAVSGLICNRPGSLRKITPPDAALRQIFVDSLRERRFMDVYFLSTSVRIIGRWDRTDLILAKSEEIFPLLQIRAAEAGLFFLRN